MGLEPERGYKVSLFISTIIRALLLDLLALKGPGQVFGLQRLEDIIRIRCREGRMINMPRASNAVPALTWQHAPEPHEAKNDHHEEDGLESLPDELIPDLGQPPGPRQRDRGVLQVLDLTTALPDIRWGDLWLG